MMTVEQDVLSCAPPREAPRAQDNNESIAQEDVARAVAQLQSVLDGVAVAGVWPIGHAAATWIVEERLRGRVEAAHLLNIFLDVVDRLAAQTATIADTGALRALGHEATSLRKRAAMLRACRRMLADLGRDLALPVGQRSGR